MITMKEKVADVKQEIVEPPELSQQKKNNNIFAANHNNNNGIGSTSTTSCSININDKNAVISISSCSSSSSDGDSLFGWDTDSDFSDMEDGSPRKKQRIFKEVLPVGFLDPLPPEERLAMQQQTVAAPAPGEHPSRNGCIVNNPVMSLIDPTLKQNPVKEEPLTVAVDPTQKQHSVKEEPLAVVVEDQKAAIVGSVDVHQTRRSSSSTCVKQFWKAGDYDGGRDDGSVFASETGNGMIDVTSVGFRLCY